MIGLACFRPASGSPKSRKISLLPSTSVNSLSFMAPLSRVVPIASALILPGDAIVCGRHLRNTVRARRARGGKRLGSRRVLRNRFRAPK